MSDNIIYDSNNNTHIGFQKDLVAYLKTCLDDYKKDDDWEQVKDIADLLLDFNGWQDNENLLVLSNNNGMGYTIREYGKEKTGEQKIDRQELIKELDDLCKRLQDDYNGVKEFKQYEEDRLVVYDVIELLEKGE